MSLFESKNHSEVLEKYLPRALRYLSYRERCSGELRQYLKNKLDCSSEQNEEIIAYFVESDLINDSRFCELRINYRINNGYGELYIRRELFSLKISSEIIKQNLDVIEDVNFIQGSIQKALSKYKILSTKWEGATLKNKLIQYLCSRGHSGNIALKIYNQIIE